RDERKLRDHGRIVLTKELQWCSVGRLVHRRLGHPDLSADTLWEAGLRRQRSARDHQRASDVHGDTDPLPHDPVRNLLHLLRHHYRLTAARINPDPGWAHRPLPLAGVA